MKNIKYINKEIVLMLLAIITISLGSCSKDFLETQPTELISQEKIAEISKVNTFIGKSGISGIYSIMYTPFTGGTESQEDFGQKGYDIYMDMLCGDMVLAASTYGWYSEMSRLNVTIDFTNNGNYRPWRYYYRVIRQANVVIDRLGGNDAKVEVDENKYTMGQAKAMRAYAYFYLANLYAKEYNASDKILPIYTTAGAVNFAKSTTEEVYKQIVKDLTEAISLLDDFNRESKSEVNKTVAQGLLSYTYAAMGEWEKVKNLTDDIISSGEYRLVSSDEATGGFNDVNTPGWMWGVDLTTNIGLDLISWWGQVDYFTYSYASVGDYKVINADLYDKISDRDVRKSQFLDNPKALIPWNKFYDPARIPQGQRKIETDYIYMRVAEMYLLNAEANANLGSEVEAKNKLKVILSERFASISDYSYIDALTGDDLLEEIYLQTRMELWGEGKSYLAMKRNRATIVMGSNHLYKAGESFEYNSDELTFSIPQSEILNNPEISKGNK